MREDVSPVGSDIREDRRALMDELKAAWFVWSEAGHRGSAWRFLMYMEQRWRADDAST